MRATTLTVLGTILLVGCTTVEPFDLAPARVPVVREARYGFVVHFPTDRAEPDAFERARLEAFLAGLPRVGRYRAIVHGHADERASDAYNLALATARALCRGGLASAGDRAGGAGYLCLRRALPGRPAPWGGGLGAQPAGGDRDPPLRGGCARVRRVGPRHRAARPTPLAGTRLCDARQSRRHGGRSRGSRRGRALAPADGVREAEAVQRYRSDKVKQLGTERVGP